ncbi:hypothetical protein [Acinetobacter tianfuensis]|nr:hypothetical protein [Acinetobacter tianfuensis]
MKLGDKVVLKTPFSSPIMIVRSINGDDVCCEFEINGWTQEVNLKENLLKTSPPEVPIGMIEIDIFGWKSE